MTKTTKYARIENNTVVEVIEINTDQQLSNLYHPSLAATFVECPYDVANGWTYINSKFEEPETIKIDLGTYKASLKNEVDQAAEKERLKYITNGVGQSMTYTEKVNQASNYAKAYAAHLNDSENVKAPNENEYLLLKSSLGIDGNTLAEVSENITWAYALWEQVGAAIETIRLQTKAAIDKAETVEAAQAIFDGVKWPKP